MKIIEVLPEELQGDQADNYEILSHKVTHRLAQQQASFVVIEERRPVIREKPHRSSSPHPPPIAYWTTASPMSAFGRNAGGQVSIPLTPAPATSEINGGGYHRFSKPAYPIDQQSHCLAQTHCGGAVLQRTAESGAGHRRDAHQGRPERAGKMKQGYFWPMYGDQDELAFRYCPGRTIQHLTSLVDGFKGTLLTDGYAAYAHFAARESEVTHAQCWAHTRRGFEKAQDMEPDAVAEALTLVGSSIDTKSTFVRPA